MMIENYLTISVVVLQLFMMFAGIKMFMPKLDIKKFSLFFVIVMPFIVLAYDRLNVLATGVLWLVLCIVTLYLSQDIFESIFCVSSAMLLYVLGDYSLTWFLGKFNLELNFFLRAIVSAIIYLVIVLIVKQTFFRYLDKGNIIINALTSGMTFLVYFVIISVERDVNASDAMIRTNFWFLMSYVLLSIVIAIVVIRVLKERYEVKEAKREIENYKKLADITEDHYRDVRKFKHDYKNVLLSLEGFLAEDDLEGLRKYFYSVLKESTDRIEGAFLDTKQLDNLESKEIKGIVVEKLLQASTNNIKVVVDIPVKVAGFPIPTLDLVRIVGILFDNAVEACIENTESKIDFAIYSKTKTIVLVVSNTCDTTSLAPIYQLRQRNFSTKGINRGLGLANLDELVDKNKDLILDTHINEGRFTQVLTFMKGREGNA